MRQLFGHYGILGYLKILHTILQIDGKYVQTVSGIHDYTILVLDGDRQVNGRIRSEDAEHGMNGETVL